MATPKDPRTNLSSEELDAKIDELTSHLHHSRYLEAAEQAALLWEQGVRDLRILGAHRERTGGTRVGAPRLLRPRRARCTPQGPEEQHLTSHPAHHRH